ncbi:MAG: hypothetical protein IKU70_01620 [Clostridia bacterium]|nr:hypothetical protein [Clostridia bacterium]
MFLTVAMMVACIFCYTFQGLFGKMYSAAYTGEESDATPVFSCLYGVIVGVSVLAAALGFRLEASPVTWGLGIANGLTLFLYNLGVIKASRLGPFSLQSIFRLFGGVVMPMLFATLFWGETLTALQIAGIVVMLASFVVINLDGNTRTSVQKGFAGWIVLLFIVNGLYGTIMAGQQRLMAGAQGNEMIVVTFLSSALISLISLIVSRKKDTLKAFRMSGKAWGSAVGAGIVAALAVVQLMMLINRVESLSVFYTIENGMVLVMTVVLSAILFKEKLNRNVIIGIVMSVISLALLSL